MRLRPVVPEVPKSMARINGKPFLEYQIDWLKGQGVKKFVLCTGYKFKTIEEYFKDGSKWAISIIYSREARPLGTAGALKNAEKHLDEQFLLANGDTFSRIILKDLIACHYSNKSDITICVTEPDGSESYGNILVDEQGIIVRFTEKQAPELFEGNLKRYVSAGFYYMQKNILQYIPPQQKCSLEENIFPLLAESNVNARVYPCEAFWDIGTPERYRGFLKSFQKQ